MYSWVPSAGGGSKGRTYIGFCCVTKPQQYMTGGVYCPCIRGHRHLGGSSDLDWVCQHVLESADYWLIYAGLSCDNWGDLVLNHDSRILQQVQLWHVLRLMAEAQESKHNTTVTFQGCLASIPLAKPPMTAASAKVRRH